MCRKLKVRWFHWHMSYKLPAGISFQVCPNCIFIVLFGFLVIILAADKFLFQSWSPHRFINMMASYIYNWYELHFKHKVPFQIMKTWGSYGFEFTLNALALKASCSVCYAAAEATYVSCYVPIALRPLFLHAVTLL